MVSTLPSPFIKEWFSGLEKNSVEEKSFTANPKYRSLEKENPYEYRIKYQLT